VVIEELLPPLGHADGGEGQQRRRTGGQLGVDLGRDLLGLRKVRGNLAADGLAAVAVVEPPGPVVPVEGHLAHAEAGRGAALATGHGTHCYARNVHQTCTRVRFLECVFVT
jgi:hypothetical protein